MSLTEAVVTYLKGRADDPAVVAACLDAAVASAIVKPADRTAGISAALARFLDIVEDEAA